jgi:hypothetical protein
MHYTRLAWIEEITTIEGQRFRVVAESALFPGCRNNVQQTWSRREGARKYIARMREVYTPGECPLRPITDADRAAYRSGVDARRALRAEA